MEEVVKYLLNSAIDVVLPVLGAIVAGLAGKALYKITKVLGITIEEKEQSAIINNVKSKVLRIEEINAWNVKQGNKSLIGEQKMMYVVDRVYTEINGKIAKVDIKDIAHAVIAELPKFGSTK